MENVRVAAVQFEPVQGDKRANLEKIRWFAGQAAQQGVQLLVFPECCITGYWFLRRLSRDELDCLAEPVFTVIAGTGGAGRPARDDNWGRLG